MAGFAQRDQNSSVGATYTRRSPEGPGQRPTLTARSGYFAGKARGVGHKSPRDENSSPGATKVQPRTLDGRFASHVPHENDVRVIRPSGKRVSTQPKTSELGIHRKGRGAETRGHVERSRRGNTRFGSTGTRGKRLS